MSTYLAPRFETLTIPAASGVSNWVAIANAPNFIPAWLEFPAAWTGATPQLYFEHATSTAVPGGADARSVGLLDGVSTELLIPFVALRTVFLPAGNFAGLMWLRIGAGTSAAPVVQAADRVVKLGRREFT